MYQLSTHNFDNSLLQQWNSLNISMSLPWNMNMNDEERTISSIHNICRLVVLSCLSSSIFFFEFLEKASFGIPRIGYYLLFHWFLVRKFNQKSKWVGFSSLQSLWVWNVNRQQLAEMIISQPGTCDRREIYLFFFLLNPRANVLNNFESSLMVPIGFNQISMEGKTELMKHKTIRYGKSSTRNLEFN